jgi:simple sugar transport system substrate-binding protein
VFAVDGSSTQGVAATVAARDLAAHGVRAGGFELSRRTLELIETGAMDFTIDPQAYQQGFYAAMAMFATLTKRKPCAAADIDTGVTLVTRDNVARYLATP